MRIIGWGNQPKQPACPQRKSHGSAKVGPQSTKDTYISNGGFHGNSGRKVLKFAFPYRKRCTSKVVMEHRTDRKCGNVDVKVNRGGSDQVQLSGKVNSKRKREQVSESSESCDTESWSDSEKEDVKELEQKGSASFKGSLPDGNVDIEETREEKTKGNGIKNCSEAVNDSASNMNPERNPDLEFYTDFSNFDIEEGCFKVGQIWACYDTVDVMPRFYVRIENVYSSGFKLFITWLDPVPDGMDEITWVNEDLPVSCGKFVCGKTQFAENSHLFSHLINWERGSCWNSYKIYPRIGETWALFKNWDIKWKSDANSKRTFEFEFVEILSEYVEGCGTFVAHLGKVRGFSCLFCRTVKGGVDSFEVPRSQLFRFSHQVPSFKMTGEEREDVPIGSFELDPAALPPNLEEIDNPENFEVSTGRTHNNGSCYKTPSDDAKRTMEPVGSASMCQVQKKADVYNEGRSSHGTTLLTDSNLARSIGFNAIPAKLLTDLEEQRIDVFDEFVVSATRGLACSLASLHQMQGLEEELKRSRAERDIAIQREKTTLEQMAVLERRAMVAERKVEELEAWVNNAKELARKAQANLKKLPGRCLEPKLSEATRRRVIAEYKASPEFADELESVGVATYEGVMLDYKSALLEIDPTFDVGHLEQLLGVKAEQ